jgi:S1-C subfamily serine protease
MIASLGIALRLGLLIAAPQDPHAYDPERAARDPNYQRRVTPEVLVVSEVAPAVVRIESSFKVFAGWNVLSGERIDRDSTSTGTGFVFYEDGYIVTNYHVVANGDRIAVRFDSDPESEVFSAQLVSHVAAEDLALLKIDGAGRKFPVLRMGTSSDVMIGERVLAIGNPLHQELTVSAGIISGLGRDIIVSELGLHFTNLLQTDASINPGNSGGPLLNIHGEVIGINTVVNRGAENMGFAIPIDRVREVIADQLFAPELASAWLGFDLTDRDLEVARVIPGGPAAAAGLSPGERIVAIEGTPIASSDEYLRKRMPLLPGEPVRLRVAGSDGERNLELVAWTKTDGLLFERTGFTVSLKVRNPPLLGVEVISPRGPAADLGLQPADVIEAVRPQGSNQAFSLHSPEAFASLISQLEPGTVLEIDILRDDNGNRRLESNELYKGKLVLR